MPLTQLIKGFYLNSLHILKLSHIALEPYDVDQNCPQVVISSLWFSSLVWCLPDMYKALGLISSIEGERAGREKKAKGSGNTKGCNKKKIRASDIKMRHILNCLCHKTWVYMII